MDVVERLTLQSASEHALLASEHRHRYELARGLVAGLRVLDLCCGTGYGSEILADTAREVVGVDNDAATVDIAQATVGRREDVSFRAADAVRFLRSEETAESFDAIVCFEGLEHLPDPGAALAAFRELAERGMKLVVSVPNSKLFEEDNPFHATDFGWAEAQAAFAGFPATTLLPQFLAEGSLILPPGATETEVAVVLDERADPDGANHFIFCSNWGEEALTRAHRGRILLAAAPVYNRYVSSLEKANQDLWRTNARLGRGHLARVGSASPSHLAKLEARIDEARAEAAMWRRRYQTAQRIGSKLEPGVRMARRAKRVARKVARRL